MPDPNNPNPTQDTPVTSLPPAEAPPAPPADLPPMDDSSGSSAPPFDIPPIVAPPAPKKKFGGGRMVATILGLLVLVGGLGAGIVLVRQQQLFQQKAAGNCGQIGACGSLTCPSGCKKVQQGVGICSCEPVATSTPSPTPTFTIVPTPPTATPKPPTQTPSPPPPTATATPKPPTPTAQPSCTSVSGQFCNDVPCSQDGLTAVITGTCPGGLQKYCCKSSTPTSTLTPSPSAPPVSCTWQQGIPDHPTGNVCIDSHTRCEVWVVDYGMPYSCPEPPKNGTSCVTSKSGQKLCYAGNTDHKNWWLITGTGETTNRNCVQDATCGGGGGPTAQCLNVKAYDTAWTQLSADQLKALKAGDKVRFTVTGSATAGVFDKAKFKINGVESPEITAKKPGTEEFFDEFTIPAGVETFTINAQIHHATLGWSN